MANKPWMERRSKETVAQWQARLNRTCYACGHESKTTKDCDIHERVCPKAR